MRAASLSQRILLILAITIIFAYIGSVIAVHAEDDDDERENDREWEREEWDLSDDFTVVEEVPVVPIPAPVVAPTPAPASKSANTPFVFNDTPYKDDDKDSVPNKDDKFPGQDDLALRDSDKDSVTDRDDLFPGQDDKGFWDQDRDGILDKDDSDMTKPTDKDHDGIDDSQDPADDRSIITRFLAMLGII